MELFYDGVWHDIAATNDVYDDPIVIKRGQSDEGSAFRPCSIVCSLANDDDRYRTSNPMSALYGKAGRNTPVRVKVGGTVRGTAEAASWAADQTQDFRQSPPRGKAWVDLEGGGLLQRLGQWSQPLRSALYRYVALSGVTPAEWWPMEDVDGSSVATSASGGNAMVPVTAVRYTLPDGSVLPPGGTPKFADGKGITGSAGLPSFQGGGTLSAPVRSATFDGYAIDWVMQFQAGTDEGGTTSADVLSWRESGTYVHFTVNVIKGFVTVFHANAADDATLTSTGSATAALDVYDGAAHHFRYQVVQGAGFSSAGLYIDSALYATGQNFVHPGFDMPGTVGQPTSIEWNPGEDRGDYLPIAAGHLIIWASGQVGGQPAVFNALNGYAGERTAYRLGRLLTEEDLPYFVSVGFDESAPMGPQRPDTLPNLLKEIVDTEDGLLFDLGDDVRVQFVCRFDRYNQTPALELTPTDLPALPREVTDDLDVHNVVTAKQRDGGDATARDDTGPLGTQASPAGVGEYQQSVGVNIADEAGLPQVANWWLRRGTVNLPRFPQLTIDLNAKPGLIAAVEAVEVGSVITIDGFREDLIRLDVLGWTETIGTHTRTVTFVCAPDQQFDVAIQDGDKRQESYTSTLNASYNSTVTTMVVRFTVLADQWSQVNEPFDWIVAGERITVTSMGAVTGSGPWTQTATVTRSVNGVVKAQTSGTPVHMHPDQQARQAL